MHIVKQHSNWNYGLNDKFSNKLDMTEEKINKLDKGVGRRCPE